MGETDGFIERDDAARAEHERWLRQLTAIPTAAGREGRVVEWIESWLDERPGLLLRRDDAGNMFVERAESGAGDTAPLYITAHLDHPAFVVEGHVGDGALNLSFRGGVRDPYFVDAPIEVVLADDSTRRATVVEAGPAEPYRRCVAELESGDASGIEPGDIARWALPDPEVIGGEWHTHACDDLAAVAAALAALDTLGDDPRAAHVGLIFTRAEEVGFIGAIHACKHGAIPPGARCVLLENSRSFPESPIGGGPIVRVGDRLSTFSPALTAGLAKLGERLAKDREGTDRPFKSQRRLMPGGACESTVYQAYGYESACLCLPLGAYHNMADLDRVERGDEDAVASARCGREHIALDDYQWLVDLLVAAGTGLGAVEPMIDRLERLYDERSGVLEG